MSYGYDRAYTARWIFVMAAVDDEIERDDKLEPTIGFNNALFTIFFNISSKLCSFQVLQGAKHFDY